MLFPILSVVNKNEILILGGYYEYDGESYTNNNIQVYNVRSNYFSKIGKG